MAEIPKKNQVVDPRLDDARRIRDQVREGLEGNGNEERADSGEKIAEGMDELRATFAVLHQLPYMSPDVMTTNTDGVVPVSAFNNLIDEWIDSFAGSNVGYDYAKYFQVKEFPGLGDELLNVYVNISYDERTGIVSMDIAFKVPSENFRSYHLDQLFNLDAPGAIAGGFRKLRELAFTGEEVYRKSQSEEDDDEDIEPLASN